LTETPKEAIGMEQEAILFANEAFYRAFADRDLEAMNALWARRLPIACVHPGWGPLTDRNEIMESWRGILSGTGPFDVTCRDPRAFLVGDTAAFVVCFEAINNGFLVATNVFAREDGAWKLVHHQAGPTADRPGGGDEDRAGNSVH
jgi:hypothetical protein